MTPLLRIDLLGDFRLLLVLTMRVEERQEEGRLEMLLGELRRSRQLSEIELGPLDEAETFSLAVDVAGRELDPALAALLYRGSEGNTLFVVKMVRAGRTADSQRMIKHGKERTGLDELWRRHIVREQGAEAYDFAHDRIREVTYAGLSAARRRFLHRRMAEALEAMYAADLDTIAAQVAAHYEQAGQVEQAIPHYQRAAGAAGRIYASEEAVDHLRRTIELLPATHDDGVRTARLYEHLGNILPLTGDHEEAHRAYDVAVAQAPGSEKLWRSRLQCELANTWRSRQRYQEANGGDSRSCCQSSGAGARNGRPAAH